MINRLKILVLLFIISFSLFSQDVELDRINALDEFKWGVRFYNQGLYEKSVFSFERSLSYDSMDNRTHLWLGWAYYMKGDVEAALKEWEILKEGNSAPLWLQTSSEIINARRGVLNRLYAPSEWVTLFSTDIKRPSSIIPLRDGGSIVVSFTDNLLTRINTNGAIINRFNGGFEPFNRPFDIIENGKGGYIVSEFMGDSISFVNQFGVKEKTLYQDNSPLSGPGFLALGDDGYFYVSDWGNRRVCKFDSDGNLVLSIVNTLLKRPTGIVVKGSSLYIADSVSRSLYLFDSSGNYLDTLIDGGLESPEGLSFKDDNIILIADGLTVKEFDIRDNTVEVLSDLQGKASRITKAVSDINGNTLVADFNRGEFYSLTDISSLYGGLFIVIDRITTRRFPSMEIELQVYNRLGEPVVGLDNTNFLISENGNVVPEREVLFRGVDNRSVNMGLILDLDENCLEYHESYYDIAKTIYNELETEDRVSLIKSGSIPVISSELKEELLDSVADIQSDEFSTRDGVDMAIKLAASNLIPSRSKREVVLVTTGEGKDNDFIKYSLGEVNDFLINNRISLNIIYLKNITNPELEYLVKESGGFSRYLFSGPGSKGVVDEIRDKKSGFYVLGYDSYKNIDNGELFTTVEVEVNYIRKSGRSESGFFVPVKIVE